MSTKIPDDILALLRVEASTCSAVESIAVPASDVGHGLVALDDARFDQVDAFVAAIEARANAFASVQSAQLEGVGLGVDVDAHDAIAHVFDLYEQALDVQALGGQSPQRAVQAAGDNAYLMLGHARAFLLRTRRGDTLCLFWNPPELRLLTLYERVVEPEPLATLHSPAAEWMKDTADPWLADAIARRVEGRGAWGHACAAGLYGRLRQETPARTREIIERLLRGEADEREHRAWRWAKSLSAAQVATLTELLASEVERMSDTLSWLRDELRPADDDWRAAYWELRVERDDAQCVVAILHQAGAPDAGAALGDLDHAAENFVLAAPSLGAAPDDGTRERLRRVELLAPDVWWVADVRRDSL